MEDHLVGWTLATTGAKAGERFKKDIAAPLVRLYPDKRTRVEFVKVELSKGSEGLVFRNGSYFTCTPPVATAFAPNAFDDAWSTRQGEAEQRWEKTWWLPSGRPSTPAMVRSSSCPAPRRSTGPESTLGPPHRPTLCGAPARCPRRPGPPRTRSYGGRRGAPLARVRELVIAAHPGIGFTTPLSVIEEDWNTPAMRKELPPEILGLFALEGSNTALISAPKWNESAKPMSNAGKTAPRKFALAAFIDRDSLYASVAARGPAPTRRSTSVSCITRRACRASPPCWPSWRRCTRRRSRTTASPTPWRCSTEHPRGTARTTGAPLGSRERRPRRRQLRQRTQRRQPRHHDQAELNAAVDIAVKRAFSIAPGWASGRPRTATTPTSPASKPQLSLCMHGSGTDGSASIKDAITLVSA